MLKYPMVKTSTLLLAVIFLTSKVQDASAEEVGAYVPFVAVDAKRGTFDPSTKSELARASIGHKLLDSPITSEQLKGASVLLISGGFRSQLTNAKEGEITEKLYSNPEIAAIKDFVENGGILIGAGISWTWVYPAYGNKSPESFPLNQIGEALNFSILDQCEFEEYDRKFFSLVKAPKDPVGAVFSNVEFKGASQKLIHSNKGICGGGAKRGKGYIYIFGHQIILANHPEFVSTIFLGSSPQKRTKTDSVDNDPKESEPEEQPEISRLPQTIPEVAASNINPLDLLAQEGSNMIAWVTSPLDVDIPDNFRANISLLREDLLDGHDNGGVSPEIYRSAVELCDNLMACIDKKEKQQIDAKLRVAQAKQRSPLSNQALEARRNYLMSWPQYHREVRQREVLSEEKADNAEVKASELELAWIETAGKLRKALDVKYSAYRAALRKK